MHFLHLCYITLNISSKKSDDNLTTAALGFTQSTAITTVKLSARAKDDTDASLTFSSRARRSLHL